jgi:hypothetical protein
MAKVVPKKTRNGAIKDVTIAKALKETCGLQSLAAELLGVTHQCISKRVRLSPYLQQIVEHFTELGLDEAQRSLRNKILAEDLGAICFLLKTKGKHRGFTENTQVLVSPEAMNMMNSLMHQTQELQIERKKAQSST